MKISNQTAFEATVIKVFIRNLKTELSRELVCWVHGYDNLYFDDYAQEKQEMLNRSYKDACDNTFIWLSGLSTEKMGRLVAYLNAAI